MFILLENHIYMLIPHDTIRSIIQFPHVPPELFTFLRRLQLHEK